MRRRAASGFALVALTIALQISVSGDAHDSQKAAGPAVSRDWKRLKSQNFVAEGTASGRLIQRWLEDLETFRSCLASLFPDIKLVAPVPSRIVVLGDDDLVALAPLQENGRPDSNVAGYFLPAPEANYLVVSNTSGGQSVMYHEYTHFVIRQAVNGPIPTWVDEGLAEFYSTFSVDRGKRLGILGLVNPRYSAISDGRLLPLQKMIVDEDAAKFTRDDNDVQSFYAQAWALVHYLSVGHKGTRSGQLHNYIVAVASGKSSETAFRDAFHVSPEQLQNELRTYLSGLTIPAATVPMPEVREAAGPAEPMFEWEAQVLQGRILTNLGRVDDAAKMLARAETVSPTETGVMYAVAGLRRYQGRPEEALAALEPLVSRDSNAFGLRFEYACALTDVGQHEKAILEYERAYALNPGVPSLWYGLSLSLAAGGRFDDAEAAMKRLRRFNPDLSWYRRRSEAAATFGIDRLVVDDALRYTDAVGFKTESGMYTALHAVLAGRRIKADTKVKTLLEGLEGGVKPKSWPAAILSFLQGTMDGASLVKRASGNGQLTEAHAFVGLLASIEGREDEALQHLRWVIERGSRNYVEYQLVQAEMKRRAK